MDQIQAANEEKAIEALSELLPRIRALVEEAEKVRQLCEEAGMALPPTVASLLGPRAANGRTPRIVVTPPEAPPRPQEAGRDWIWVPAANLTPTSLVLALLRLRGDFVSSNELFSLVTKHDPNANHGSMLNIGARLDGTLIERSEQGWRLMDQSKAPILFKCYGWGPVNVFVMHEQWGRGDRFDCDDHGRGGHCRHHRGCDKPDPEPEQGSLSGFVFLDDNGNGVLDEGEQPLPNAAVVLTWNDADGVPREMTVETGADGAYIFENLEGGIEYTITEVQPFPFQDGPDYVGSLGGEQAEDQFRVVLPTGAQGVNYNFTEVVGE
jgi:hypothetical protein